MVPFPAGGATDVIARLVADLVSKEWKRPIVINNRAGATGAIGSEYVARAKPDGYTLMIATGSTHAVLPAYRHDLPYDTVTSFAPATLLAVFPNILVVNPKKVPATDLPAFIEHAKKNPGKLTYGSSGKGSSIHLAGELFKLMTGTDMVHVPYRGSAPAVTDLLAGHIDLMFDNMSSIWSQVQDGSLRALGVASLDRTPLAPDLPAIAETLSGFEATTWVGVVGPAGIPNDVPRKDLPGFRAGRRAARGEQAAQRARGDAGVQRARRVHGFHPARPAEVAERRSAGGHQAGVTLMSGMPTPAGSSRWRR